MSFHPQPLPTGPTAVRVFVGYRRRDVSKETFFAALGETFMPGTPYMQAPLGLSAYLPSVLDFDDDRGLPDEVALIVYPSLEVYNSARKASLRRRMYTYSHSGVFDMKHPGGGGQFPGLPGSPTTREDRQCWHLFDHAVDWQAGTTSMLFYAADEGRSLSPPGVIEATTGLRVELKAAGIHQLIGVATEQYAVLWLHVPDGGAPPETLTERLTPANAVLARSLVATVAPMPTLTEGVTIAGASMFCFRFVRDLRFFLGGG